MLKKIASNTISQILSKVFTAIISIFLIKALTTYLSVDEYGLYNKIYSYLGIFAFLADLGLYTITVREIRAGKEKTSKII
jgi:O-antigen/teichoic acid export membrane protein